MLIKTIDYCVPHCLSIQILNNIREVHFGITLRLQRHFLNLILIYLKLHQLRAALYYVTQRFVQEQEYLEI